MDKQLQLVSETEAACVRLSAELQDRRAKAEMKALQMQMDQYAQMKQQLKVKDKAVLQQAKDQFEKKLQSASRVLDNYMSPEKIVGAEAPSTPATLAKISPLRPPAPESVPFKKRGRPAHVGQDVPLATPRKRSYGSMSAETLQENSERAAKLKKMRQASMSDASEVSQLFGDETGNLMTEELSANVSDIIRTLDTGPSANSTPKQFGGVINVSDPSAHEIRIPGGSTMVQEVQIQLPDGQLIPLSIELAHPSDTIVNEEPEQIKESRVSIEIFRCPRCEAEFTSRDDRDTHINFEHPEETETEAPGAIAAPVQQISEEKGESVTDVTDAKVPESDPGVTKEDPVDQAAGGGKDPNEGENLPAVEEPTAEKSDDAQAMEEVINAGSSKDVDDFKVPGNEKTTEVTPEADTGTNTEKKPAPTKDEAEVAAGDEKSVCNVDQEVSGNQGEVVREVDTDTEKKPAPTEDEAEVAAGDEKSECSIDETSDKDKSPTDSPAVRVKPTLK